jgi:hypothetical protein
MLIAVWSISDVEPPIAQDIVEAIRNQQDIIRKNGSSIYFVRIF